MLETPSLLVDAQQGTAVANTELPAGAPPGAPACAARARYCKMAPRGLSGMAAAGVKKRGSAFGQEQLKEPAIQFVPPALVLANIYVPSHGHVTIPWAGLQAQGVYNPAPSEHAAWCCSSACQSDRVALRACQVHGRDAWISGKNAGNSRLVQMPRS